MSSERPPPNGDPQADNPYAAPQTMHRAAVASPPAASRPPRLGWRVAVSAACLLLGCMSLSVLDFQAFTSAIEFLIACMVSALVWAPLLRTPHRRRAQFVLAMHLAIMLAISMTLPGRWISQQQANSREEDSMWPGKGP